MKRESNKAESVQRAGTSKRRPVALVTGASSGFGMLAVIALARQGYRVVATMRDLGKQQGLWARAADEKEQVSQNIEVACLDVTDEVAMDRVLADIMREHGTIDLLVNNAGMAVGGFVEEVPMTAWRAQLETNFFSVVALTTKVLPIMRSQNSGMIINIGSVSGRVAFPGYGPYAASKFAIEGFSESLRHEVAPLGIRVVLIEPGAYRTAIWGKGLAQMHSRADSPYASRLQAITRYSRQAGETAPDPEEIGELIARIAVSRSPKLRYVRGRGSRMAIMARSLLPWKWFERLIERATRS